MMAKSNRRFARQGIRREKGFTLFEAFIAFVVLAGGLLAAFSFHNTTMSVTAEAKVRAEATALAKQKLEDLRNFQTSEQFNNLVVDGNGLGDYAAVDYAADFTLAWDRVEGYGDNPRQVDVTVAWTDRDGSAQTVMLSSIIWRNEPGDGAANLALALSVNGDPTEGFGDSYGNPIVSVGGDGGTVNITDVIISSTSNPIDGDNNGVYSYDIEFFGDILFTDEGLESVGISGVQQDSASCDIFEGITYKSGTQEDGTAFDDSGDPDSEKEHGDPVHDSSGIALSDVYGNPAVYKNGTPVVDDNGNPVVDDANDAVLSWEATLMVVEGGAGGFKYRCTVKGVPDNETWNGTLTYDPSGNDAVCVPGPSLEISISQTTEFLELAVVVMTNNGACPN
ncbi:MAG: hypothetical protein COA75_12000 [Cellvibrionales bacterium]|nr:MAG: hypothetical protein COA75_12000 [Cellvibrionales bacterium]